MWDLPRPGLEPVSPALAGRFSTTAPPGKPSAIILKAFTQMFITARNWKQSKFPGNSLVVQWLGLHAFTAKSVGSIPGWGTEILQVARYGQINK